MSSPHPHSAHAQNCTWSLTTALTHDQNGRRSGCRPQYLPCGAAIATNICGQEGLERVFCNDRYEFMCVGKLCGLQVVNTVIFVDACIDGNYTRDEPARSPEQPPRGRQPLDSNHQLHFDWKDEGRSSKRGYCRHCGTNDHGLSSQRLIYHHLFNDYHSSSKGRDV